MKLQQLSAVKRRLFIVITPILVFLTGPQRKQDIRILKIIAMKVPKAVKMILKNNLEEDNTYIKYF